METQALETLAKKALIIDDEAGIRRNLTFGLAQHGFLVDDVENGFSALQQIEAGYDKKTPYQYIISDIILPDINGLKLLEVIKSRHPKLPVVMISGHGTDTTMKDVEVRHGDGYLSKPFLVQELVTVLDRMKPVKADPPQVADEIVPSRSASSYFLVRLEKDVDALGIFRKLYFMDNVLYCDAVRGAYDIVLLLNAGTKKELEHIVDTKLFRIKGVTEVDWLPVVKPSIGKDMEKYIADYERKNKLLQGVEKMNQLRHSLLSYLFLEVDVFHLRTAYLRLYFLNEVVFCDRTKGKYNMILLINSPTFKAMEDFVEEQVRPMAGIVRSKLLHVINVLEG
ncbi:MAG: response regulator [Proteobacteria bacterium]|nr:response regulator [Pseudomonadota bacterium]